MMGKTSRHKTLRATATAKSASHPDNKSVEFIGHVRELRSRIFWVAVLFIVASVLAYQYRDILIDVVLSPLGHQKLIYLNPAGGFSFIFQITMYAGALAAAPFLVFQLYRFVTPALPRRAQKHAAKIFLAAVLLMVAGVAFGYFVAVPAALGFLTEFAGGYVDASLTADSYLNFVLGYVVGLGIMFQLPLLLIFWHWIKPLTPSQILGSERFMIVFSLIAAAIITPTPDIMNQLLIAGPILVIYQIGVVAILIMIAKERKRKARAERLAAGATQSNPSALPMLDLPTLEDLMPRKPILTSATTSISSKPQPIKVASVPVKRVVKQASSPKQVPLAVDSTKAALSKPPPSRSVPRVSFAPPPRRILTPSDVLRPRGSQASRHTLRQVPAERPLPSIPRQRHASLDGFVTSS